MKFSFQCPSCKHNMGIIRLIMAFTPFIFTCIKCRSTLRAKGVFAYIALVFFLASSIIIGSLAYLLSNNGTIDPKILLFGFAVFFVAEVTNSIIVCNKANITVKTNRFKPKK